MVPMGWNHALDLAQTHFSYLVSEAWLGLPCSMLVEGLGVHDLDQGVAGVHVDNFVFASSSRSASVEAFNRVKTACTKMGLPHS